MAPSASIAYFTLYQPDISFSFKTRMFYGNTSFKHYQQSTDTRQTGTVINSDISILTPHQWSEPIQVSAPLIPLPDTTGIITVLMPQLQSSLVYMDSINMDTLLYGHHIWEHRKNTHIFVSLLWIAHNMEDFLGEQRCPY